MKDKREKDDQTKTPRKVYSPPTLMHYGAIKDLTSGGTGGPEMGMMGMMLMRRA